MAFVCFVFIFLSWWKCPIRAWNVFCCLRTKKTIRVSQFKCQVSYTFGSSITYVSEATFIFQLEGWDWPTWLLPLNPTPVFSSTWQGRKNSAFGDRLVAEPDLPLASWAGYFTSLNLFIFPFENEVNMNITNIGAKDKLTTRLIANYEEHCPIEI